MTRRCPLTAGLVWYGMAIPTVFGWGRGAAPSRPPAFRAGVGGPARSDWGSLACRVWGGGGWHKASVSDCLPLAAPIGLSPLLILTLCGPERVLVVSTVWGAGVLARVSCRPPPPPPPPRIALKHHSNTQHNDWSRSEVLNESDDRPVSQNKRLNIALQTPKEGWFGLGGGGGVILEMLVCRTSSVQCPAWAYSSRSLGLHPRKRDMRPQAHHRPHVCVRLRKGGWGR